MRILAVVLVLIGAVIVILTFGIGASLVRLARGGSSGGRGPSSHERAGHTGDGSGAWDAAGPMTVERARSILGVEPGADRETVITAHRRMVQRLHPDRGGSAYLTAQLNEAKEVLLGGRNA